MVSSTEIGLLDNWSQSYMQMRTSIKFGVKELLKTSSTLPHMLNVDSEATAKMGTVNTSLAMREGIKNLLELSFHHHNTSIPSSFTIASLR